MNAFIKELCEDVQAMATNLKCAGLTVADHNGIEGTVTWYLAPNGGAVKPLRYDCCGAIRLTFGLESVALALKPATLGRDWYGHIDAPYHDGTALRALLLRVKEYMMNCRTWDMSASGRAAATPAPAAKPATLEAAGLQLLAMGPGGSA